MRSRTLIIAVLVAALAAVFAASALATSTTGKLVSMSYNASAKTGTLVIKKSSGNKTFRLSPKTGCGYSKGQSGGPMSCKTLAKAKYEGKKVFVTYSVVGGKKVVSIVSVQLNG
jgi:hypothetical protein